MSKGRKIYSLIVKNENGTYYRVKIGEDYYTTLSQIDDYCTQKNFLWNMNINYNLNIEEVYIVYKRDGHLKSLSPIFEASDNFKAAIQSFNGASEIDFFETGAHKNYPVAFLCITMLRSGVLESYQTNSFVKEVFDKQGVYGVREVLLGKSEMKDKKTELFTILCKYNNFRHTQILYENALQGKKINIAPKIVDELLDADIKLIEERELELIDEKIAEISQKTDTNDKVLINIYTEELNKLYDKQEELKENLGLIKKKPKGQLRLF